jgi:hypothetical protein
MAEGLLKKNEFQFRRGGFRNNFDFSKPILADRKVSAVAGQPGP